MKDLDQVSARAFTSPEADKTEELPPFPDEVLREMARKSFNDIPALYDKVRPGYPEAVFSQLKELTGLNENSRILEVGCGTGQATSGIAKISPLITGIDPAPDTVDLARAKFPELKFEATTFEDFQADSTYDAIFSSAAWHWVDPEIGYKKARNLLDNDGYLILLNNYHIVKDPDGFYAKADNIYRQYFGVLPNLTSRKAIDGTRNGLENDHFEVVHQVEHDWTQVYTTNEYIELRNTFSDHRVMNPVDRQNFEAQIRSVADTQFDGQVSRDYISAVFIAKKK